MSVLSQLDERVSDIPASHEQSSGLTSLVPRLAPALWLDRLLRASAEAPYEQGPEATVEHFLLMVGELLPDVYVGLTMTLPGDGPVSFRLPAGTTGDDRLFPEMACEQGWSLSFPSGAELRWGSAEPLLDDSPEALFLRHLALAVGTALRLAFQRQHELGSLQRQLAHADKLASVGRLAASTLHELTNPITSILAYTDYLRRKVERVPLEADDVERLRRISEAAERIRGLTRNLVDYTHPSESRPSPQRIHVLIDHALSFCEHTLSEAGVVVEREYDARADRVLGVDGELTQVFVNLITNACHAMPRGHGRLTLRTELAGQQIVIRVRDNGHGIPPEHLEKIFEPFFTTKALGSGTGLGLAIVRAIIERHGGQIHAESPPGQGAAFVLRLPRP